MKIFITYFLAYLNLIFGVLNLIVGNFFVSAINFFVFYYLNFKVKEDEKEG